MQPCELREASNQWLRNIIALSVEPLRLAVDLPRVCPNERGARPGKRMEPLGEIGMILLV
jgi:hypothetical protein